MRSRLACPHPGRRLQVQPQASQGLLDHQPLEDRRDELELAAAAGQAVQPVDVEDAIERTGPADAVRSNLDALTAESGNWYDTIASWLPDSTPTSRKRLRCGDPAPGPSRAIRVRQVQRPGRERDLCAVRRDDPAEAQQQLLFQRLEGHPVGGWSQGVDQDVE